MINVRFVNKFIVKSYFYGYVYCKTASQAVFVAMNQAEKNKENI